jgi:hypothetical protein
MTSNCVACVLFHSCRKKSPCETHCAHRGRKLNFLFTIQHYYGEITTEGGGGGGGGYQATSEACRATPHMQ